MADICHFMSTIWQMYGSLINCQIIAIKWLPNNRHLPFNGNQITIIWQPSAILCRSGKVNVKAYVVKEMFKHVCYRESMWFIGAMSTFICKGEKVFVADVVVNKGKYRILLANILIYCLYFRLQVQLNMNFHINKKSWTNFSKIFQNC